MSNPTAPQPIFSTPFADIYVPPGDLPQQITVADLKKGGKPYKCLVIADPGGVRYHFLSPDQAAVIAADLVREPSVIHTPTAGEIGKVIPLLGQGDLPRR